VWRVLEIAGAAKLVDEDDPAVGETVEHTVETLLGARARTEDPLVGESLRQLAIGHAMGMATGLARAYHGRGEPTEDLVQVAMVGLIKAVDGFDPERGTGFYGYAAPTVQGEIKRYFRDKGWRVRVPRRLQEIGREVPNAREVLGQRLGRSPTNHELAGQLDITDAELAEALDAAAYYRPTSLSTPVSERDGGDAVLADRLGERDHALELVDDRISLRVLLAELPHRQRRILALRFYGNLTQAQIADEVGLSQMHVSRLLADAITRLRRGLTTE
jgi:RNA polymerase sigma-B factor